MDDPAPIAIQAEAIDWERGVAHADGGVEVHFADQVLVGDRAVWDGTVLVVENGEIRTPEGVLSFDRAEVRPAAGTAILVATHGTSGGARIEAERLEVASGVWEAFAATVSPCQCADGAPPAITLRSAHVTVVPDRVVIVRKGHLRLFDIPVFPVPYARVPLDPHRFRFLLPELGWGVDGPSARVEARGGVGDWYLQGGPAWSLDRGPQAALAVAGPPGLARGAVGYDLAERAVRGVVASRGGVDAKVRVAWDAAWVSDADYLADYAVDYVTRGVGWRESRAVAAVGPGQVDVWLPDDGSSGALARGRVSFEAGRGADALTPRALVEVEGALDGPVSPVVEVGVGGRSVRSLSWLVAEGRADVAARVGWSAGLAKDGPILGDSGSDTAWKWSSFGGEPRWGDGLAAGPLARSGSRWRGLGGAASAGLAVPLWSDLGKPGSPTIQWWPGVRSEARGGWNAAGAAGSLRFGPAIRAATAWSAGGIDVDAALLQDGAGWRPAASIDVHLATVALRAQVDPDIQLGELRWMPTGVSAGIGTAHAAALWLGWTDLGVSVRRFRTGGGLTWNLGEGAFSGADARVGYDDGCAAATLTAHFGPDRAIPDVGVAATLRR